MPERFECTTFAKKALYKYSSFPVLLYIIRHGRQLNRVYTDGRTCGSAGEEAELTTDDVGVGLRPLSGTDGRPVVRHRRASQTGVTDRRPVVRHRHTSQTRVTDGRPVVRHVVVDVHSTFAVRRAADQTHSRCTHAHTRTQLLVTASFHRRHIHSSRFENIEKQDNA